MATEKWKNLATSPLDGNINDSVTSLDVIDGSKFPATGQFRVKVDDEIMLCTARSSNTLTVTRGVDDTTAASHLDTEDVIHILTEFALQQMFEDNINYLPYASVPSTPERKGRLILPTDNSAILLAKDSSDFYLYGDMQGPFAGSLLSDFATAANIGADDTLTQKGKHWHWYNAGTTPGGENLRTRTASIPAYSTWTIKAALDVQYPVLQNYNQFGIVVRENSSGEMITFAMHPRNDGASYYASYKWSNYTTGSAYFTHYNQFGKMAYLKMQYDGTNFLFYKSNNWVDWVLCHSVSATDHFGGAPDQWGLYINPYNASGNNLYQQHCNVFELSITNGLV